MAQRRMFSKSVARTDRFLDMSQSAQNLYFHLGIDADDDGFVSPKMVMRLLGSTNDDLLMLVGKGFVIPFESGVIVIRHWKENNYIQADRYKPSIYAEREKLLIDKSGIYQHENEYDPKNPDITGLKRLDTKCIQDVRVGEDRRGEERTPIASQSASFKVVPDEVKKERPKRDNQALALRDKLYALFESEKLVYPTIHMGDYVAVVNALKRLKPEQIIELVEDALSVGKVRTVREALSPRKIDIYLQDNA